MKFLKYLDRRFLLPLITILVGAAMVFVGDLSGSIWAGMAGTITAGYMGLSGWTTSTELSAGITHAQLESLKYEDLYRNFHD